MRKILTLLIITITLILIIGCFLDDSTLDKMILDGYYKSEEYWDKNGFQDYTDYCKYYYNDGNSFKENTYYKLVTQNDIDELKGYFDNFYNWMEVSNRLSEYDFLNDYISEGDYYYIKTKEGPKYDNYTVYFYDTDQNILYYIHSNI